MNKRCEILWITINVVLAIICILSPDISGNELDGILGGIAFSMAAWYFAGILELALFK